METIRKRSKRSRRRLMKKFNDPMALPRASKDQCPHCGSNGIEYWSFWYGGVFRCLECTYWEIRTPIGDNKHWMG